MADYVGQQLGSYRVICYLNSYDNFWQHSRKRSYHHDR